MADTLTPETADQVLEAVAWAAAGEAPLDVRGRGTKAAYGRAAQAAHCLDLSRLAGITAYEPSELYLTARAGTPMAEIKSALDANNQQMGFEPADLGPLLGGAAGAGTLGGVLACNLAGPRRIKAGAARDHFLGFNAVSGRGEIFKSGGRVVKNVTGFDLGKLMAGSFGTLAVMTEVTIKVLPAPEKTRTVLVMGLNAGDAVAAMTAALGSAHEVSAAAHLPRAAAARSGVTYVSDAHAAVTAVRVEGPGPSVEHRCRALRELLGGFGDVEELHSRNSRALWREIRDVGVFAAADDESRRQIWRISVPPADGAVVAAGILDELDGRVIHDWGGGLIWLDMAADAEAGHPIVRRAVAPVGGHATLVRAEPEVRARVPVFQPQSAALAALTRRVKDGFDPKGILNPGRMYAGV